MRFGTSGGCFDLLPKYNTKAWNTVTNLIEILLLKLFSDLYLQSTVNWEKRSGKTAQENNSFGTENNFGSQISTDYTVTCFMQWSRVRVPTPR